MSVEHRSIPLQRREAAFTPASFNPERRTIDLTWSTGARVARHDFWTGKRYEEELSMDPGAVHLERLNNGAPLLDSHSAYGLGGIIGVVDHARIENGRGIASVRFSERDDVAPILADVKAGIIRNVSVGYQVGKYQIEEREDAPSLYRAVDWTPMELSLVPIPADAGAQVRADGIEHPCEFEVSVMSDVTTVAPVPSPSNPAPDVAAASAAAVAAERARIAEIETLCARHGADNLRGELITTGATLDAVRTRILESLVARDSVGTESRRSSHVTVERDEVETQRQGAVNALAHRIAPSISALDDNGRQFRGHDLVSLARELMRSRGEHVMGLDKMQIATRAFQSTSDFPYILAAVANKTLRAAYEAAPQTFKPWTKQMTAADFKTLYRVQLGDAPALTKVTEAGEFTYGTVGEARESYALATYGKILAFTRQAMINDDLNAFSRLLEMFGRSAADLETDTVWAILTANAAMNDTVALFHATHANLGTTAAITVASLGEARKLLRKQTSINGKYMNLQAKYLLVPAALETVAQQYAVNTNIVYTKGSDFNPFAGAMQVIAEPRLDAASATAWYFVCDPATIDTIEYCYLEGEQGAYMEERIGFEVDGMELKCRLDFAAKAIDHRGMIKNAGA